MSNTNNGLEQRPKSYNDDYDDLIADSSFSFYERQGFMPEENVSAEKIASLVRKHLNTWKHEQDNLRKDQQISYAAFLLLDFLGKVSYATKGQFKRYLEAWQANFEPAMTLSEDSARRALLEGGYINRMEKPIIFKRGLMQNRYVSAYYLTLRGMKLLREFGIEANSHGEPEGVMFSRLQHDILIAETVVDMTAKGNFITRVKDEAQLRREMIRRGDHRSASVTDRTVSDFGVEYYHKDYDRLMENEVEVAVKYNAAQIRNKPNHVIWFCYDRKEAEKIWHWKYEKAILLGENLVNETKPIDPDSRLRKDKSEQEKGEKVPAKTFRQLYKWMAVFGGLTPDAAGLLTGMRMNDIYEQLKNVKDYTKIYTSLTPGETKGNSRTLYVWNEFADNIIKARRIFYLNIMIEFFLLNGYKCVDVLGRWAFQHQEGDTYFVIADPRTHLPDHHIREDKNRFDEIMEDLKDLGFKLLLVVANEEIKEKYDWNLEKNVTAIITKFDIRSENRFPRTSKIKQMRNETEELEDFIEVEKEEFDDFTEEFPHVF